MAWAFSASSGQVTGISLAAAPMRYSSSGTSSTCWLPASHRRITSLSALPVASGSCSASGARNWAAGLWFVRADSGAEDAPASSPEASAGTNRLTSGRQ